MTEVCFLYKWEPRVPLDEMSLDMVLKWLKFGQESMRDSWNLLLIAVSEALSGKAIKTRAFVRDLGYQAPDLEKFHKVYGDRIITP